MLAQLRDEIDQRDGKLLVSEILTAVMKMCIRDRIQPCGNSTDGEAVLVHGKDHLHILADSLIDDELVFVIRRFLVAIGLSLIHI